MRNPFKEIESDDKLPAKVKQETLSNLYTLRLMLDVVDLFSVKAGGTLSEALSGPTDHQSTD